MLALQVDGSCAVPPATIPAVVVDPALDAAGAVIIRRRSRHFQDDVEGAADTAHNNDLDLCLDSSDGDSSSSFSTPPVLDPFDCHHLTEKIGMLPLAVMVFYSVSGGPFGVEASVRSAGNFYTLLGFLIMPFVWSVQEALMTAELGTAFPEASGGVAWVEAAFGTQAGWMSGYLGWVAGTNLSVRRPCEVTSLYFY
jgi:hypothetical protein